MHTISLRPALLLALVLAPAARAELLMTAPDTLVAGRASTLLLEVTTLGDRDPATGPVATVDGQAIRIDLRNECAHISCDVFAAELFRVDLPPLAAGQYTVTAYTAGSQNPSSSFTLDVAAAAVAPSVLPADGFWMPVGMPGTGLHLQLRGETLAVSQFDQVDGLPRWRLDAPTLQGDSALAVLRGYFNGSCFGCTPHDTPNDGDATGMRLDFATARTAIATLADGAEVPLVNLPFGVPYVDAALPGAGDATFGALPLPDLSGTWAFDLHESMENARVVTLEGPLFDGATVRFSRAADAGEPYGLVCKAGNDVAPAGCELHIGDSVIGTPPPGYFPFARLGDVEEDRIRFEGGPPGAAASGFRVFYAVRLPPGG